MALPQRVAFMWKDPVKKIRGIEEFAFSFSHKFRPPTFSMLLEHAGIDGQPVRITLKRKIEEPVLVTLSKVLYSTFFFLKDFGQIKEGRFEKFW